MSFILKIRGHGLEETFVDYYEFTGREKPKSNNGTGTSFMHCYVNEVTYHKGPRGLAVRLVQRK